MTDRVRGVLRGLTAGDRIGGPVRMALQLADSLIAERRFAPEDVLRRYVQWWQAEGFDTGRVAALVFDRIVHGEAPDAAAAQVHRNLGGMTAGCNPAHRASPLAMCATIADCDLPRDSTAEARLTHLHPTAAEVSAFVVALCRRLIRGTDWDEALRSSGTVVSRPISRSGYAPDVLGAALFFVSESRDPEECLVRSIRFAGPENYSPVLAGTLAGARWGAAAIPASALRHHDDNLQHRIAEVAAELAGGWTDR